LNYSNFMLQVIEALIGSVCICLCHDYHVTNTVNLDSTVVFGLDDLPCFGTGDLGSSVILHLIHFDKPVRIHWGR